MYQARGGCTINIVDKIVIPDFIYYYIVAKGFWIKNILNIYTSDAMFKVFSEEFSRTFDFIMPYGLTPFALFPFLPLLIFKSNYDLVIFSWNFISILLFVKGCDSVRLNISKDNSQERFFWIFTVTIIFFSGQTLSTLVLGQTTLAAIGALLLLITRSRQSSFNVLDLLLVVITSVKPLYLIASFIILIELRRYKLLLITSFILCLELFYLFGKAGSEMLFDYLGILKVFSSVDIPYYYSLAFAPQTTTVFQNAFSPYFELKFLNLVTKKILTFGLLTVMFFTGCRVMLDLQKLLKLKVRLESYILKDMHIFFISVMLLFSPYIGGYEDLLLVVLAASLLRPCQNADNKSLIVGSDFYKYCFFLCIYMIVNREVLFHPYSVALIWLIKLLVISFLIFDLKRNKFVGGKPNEAHSVTN